MLLIDSHCHLDAAEFDADRDKVIAKARAAGVTRQIIPAVDAVGWPKLRGICARDAGLFPAYGLHPMYLSVHRTEHLSQLREWLESERPVAVGECGLDYFVEGPGPRHAGALFRCPVAACARVRPAGSGARAARGGCGDRCDPRTGKLRGVVHSYSGSTEQARQLWDLGFMIGLGGPVTYDRANRLRGLAATMPLEYLLLETDAPDQPDAGHSRSAQ